uniref:RING-type E3 ubiquitin transferase n=1 Tax=Picea sitchensis TaxID=3332 RepID=A9P183_PICSI|nr:unknown [Picea sitchensis]
MALSEPPALSEQKVQALFHYLDCVKSRFQRLAVRLLNIVTAFSELSPASASMVFYVFCVGMGFMMCIVMGFLDLAAGTHILEAVIDVTGGLNGHVFSALQLLNGLLALLFGFSTLLGMLNINVNRSRSSRINRYNRRTLSRRSKLIRALPIGRYGRLSRRSDDNDVNRNDSSSSSCAICLGGIGEEEGVRILPNCRHYFHISCIDRWLLLCPTNSSCPLCRASVIYKDFQ